MISDTNKIYIYPEIEIFLQQDMILRVYIWKVSHRWEHKNTVKAVTGGKKDKKTQDYNNQKFNDKKRQLIMWKKKRKSFV